MKYLFLITSLFIIFIISTTPTTYAIYDPMTRPNNRIGIHLLFPSELSKARELVNSNNGDWGYVTIPIQAGDKDITKWQLFMDEAKKLHLIPIVRLATEGDYFQKEAWRKPKDEDIVDFANFLDSLNWPVKNRYIIVFNEVNRADEWQGEANPMEYAQILSFTADTFKAKNPDFFIISSGMDNASITRDGTYSQYDFFRAMNESVPGVFDKIDGYSSHSYPNPAFSTPPKLVTKMSISSFMFEKELIDSITIKDLPIFITETGWDQQAVTKKTAAEYFKISLDEVWNKPNIIAITPFLLHAGPGPFEKFSFLNSHDEKNEIFKAFEDYKKVKGDPILENDEVKVLAEITPDLPVKDFSEKKPNENGKEIKLFIKWLLLPL